MPARAPVAPRPDLPRKVEITGLAGEVAVLPRLVFTSTEVVYGITGTDVTELPEYGAAVMRGGHRAIQRSDKITPVDQPGSCWSHRQRPALKSAPGTLAPVTQSGYLLSRYQSSARAVNRARILGSSVLSRTRRRDPVPSCVVLTRRITTIE